MFSYELFKTGNKTNPKEYKEEPIIFFEYTGKQSKYKKAKYFINNNVYKGKDYDDAERIRDEGMKK